MVEVEGVGLMHSRLSALHLTRNSGGNRRERGSIFRVAHFMFLFGGEAPTHYNTSVASRNPTLETGLEDEAWRKACIKLAENITSRKCIQPQGEGQLRAVVERVYGREDKAHHKNAMPNLIIFHRRCVLYWFISQEQIAHLSRLLSYLRVYTSE